jgi:predicted metalloenzyme YecM
MFVELPQIADKTYPVHRKTNIEMIIFYDYQDVTALAGQQISEEKTVWTGYGNYQP